MELYIKSIIQSPSDVQNLLSIGSKYGVAVGKIHKANGSHQTTTSTRKSSSTRSDNVINLGKINLDLLNHDNVYDDIVPLGYEDYHSDSNKNTNSNTLDYKTYHESLQLSFMDSMNTTKQSILTLQHHQFLPDNSHHNDVNLSIYEDDHYRDRLLTLQLKADDSQELYLKLTIKHQYSGLFKRLLLLNVNIADQSNKLVSKQTNLTLGVMITGLVVSNLVDKSLMLSNNKANSLSIEAKIFKPIPSLKMFDQQVYNSDVVMMMMMMMMIMMIMLIIMVMIMMIMMMMMVMVMMVIVMVMVMQCAYECC